MSTLYNKHPIEKLSDEQDNSLNSIQGELEYLHKDVDLDCPGCGKPLQKSYTNAANGMELDVEYDMLHCETDDINIYQHDVKYNSVGGNGGGYTQAQINHMLGEKQNTINEDNKLSADLIDDTSSTNKFTNETEKQTWNGKQDVIDNTHKLSADLVDDSSSTNKLCHVDSNGNIFIGSTQITQIIDRDSYDALSTKDNRFYLIYPTPSNNGGA